MAESIHIEFVSFVGVFDPQDTAFDVSRHQFLEIESLVKEVLQLGEGHSERGPVKVISAPSNQMDLLIENERIVARLRYPRASLEVSIPPMAGLFWRALETLKPDYSSVSWVRFGYNLHGTVLTDGLAIAKLADGPFSTEFKDKLRYPIAGAATWLWLDLPTAGLWLRLEPHRSDPSSERIAVTGNFTEERGSLPSEGQILSKFSTYQKEVQDLLSRIDL